MKIELRFFAGVREAVGTGAESIDVPADVTTVGALRSLLIARGDPWAQALAEGRVLRMACNQRMCDPGTALVDGAEVAFFPPVTGG